MIQIAEHFYTLTEAANLLGVNRITIRRWVQSGKLTAQRIGSVVLIEKHQVDAIGQQTRRPV